MSTEALIQATALNRYYGKYHAVNDVHLSIHKGEVLGLLGPNGAGNPARCRCSRVIYLQARVKLSSTALI